MMSCTFYFVLTFDLYIIIYYLFIIIYLLFIFIQGYKIRHYCVYFISTSVMHDPKKSLCCEDHTIPKEPTSKQLIANANKARKAPRRWGCQCTCHANGQCQYDKHDYGERNCPCQSDTPTVCNCHPAP